ncbi:hypothetical protein CO165_03385 [Candidatus Roizmanbacteria bacterium CG_4_9_14_3_um_filter_33_18]|uniref:Yip1 domain-containing protein n=1 Tax=Candidatus Roizmanbacteria bacterium CG_4_9_14_3_um_filter_33_18 TaxID=1974841 RepID=A0A2M7XXM5_9BACT|nr:MAG: hypothetical protein CO165_03385 [Candidatus Roizmanbacteria bacterium CG_4_9_14_3_um_filter_33_18]
MDFKKILVNFLASFFVLLKRFILLIISPYKTMRKISYEKDYYQPIIIISLVFIYFKFIYYLRDKIYPATLIYFLFIINVLLTVIFFYLLSKLFSNNKKEITFSSFVFTFSYSLFPTIIWFLSTSILYIFLPPPRTFSILGKGFSIFFVAYSMSLLIWKLIIGYLAMRFSSKQNFFKIIYMIILYLIWFIPYSIFLYQFKLFRIPFI